MTETRKWTLGTVALVLVLLLASWFLLVSPKRSEAAKLDEQTQQQQQANDALRTQIAVLKSQSKDLPAMQAKLQRLLTKVPPSPSLVTLIRELSITARRSGVQLLSITPARPAALPTVGTVTTTVAPTGLAQITLQLTASGGYFELQQLFNQLEQMDRAVLVTQATITEPDQSTTTTTGVRAPLSAAITAEVFVAPPTTTADTTAAASGATPTPTPTTSAP